MAVPQRHLQPHEILMRAPYQYSLLSTFRKILRALTFASAFCITSQVLFQIHLYTQMMDKYLLYSSPNTFHTLIFSSPIYFIIRKIIQVEKRKIIIQLLARLNYFSSVRVINRINRYDCYRLSPCRSMFTFAKKDHQR